MEADLDDKRRVSDGLIFVEILVRPCSKFYVLASSGKIFW